MSGGPWRGGITVRGLGKGGLPVADFLCGRCLYHRRVTGRQLVRDFLASHPTETHREQCPANPKDPS